MTGFLRHTPELASYWRAIILFGSNSATYKFALARSLLDLASEGKGRVSLPDLAVPYSQHLRRHLDLEDRQGTAPSSKFLDACRAFNADTLSESELIDTTVRLGFNNVLDAFHVVSGEDVTPDFFHVTQSGDQLVLTDDLFRLRDEAQGVNLAHEVEARWRLVETAWSVDINPKLLQVRRDEQSGQLYVEPSDYRRVDVTSSRDALNGYQKGRCFYCFRGIAVGEDGSSGDDSLSPLPRAEVDHFFPKALDAHLPGTYLDGVWNLVLSCPQCNRGFESNLDLREKGRGKSDRVPKLRYLTRLERRNTFLIESHHPLRETLKRQTGTTRKRRHDFLQDVLRAATDVQPHRWEPAAEFGDGFDHT